MKTIQNKFLFAFFIFTNIAFSNGPDPDAIAGDTNATDAPIEHWVSVFLLIAIVFGYRLLLHKKTSEN